MGTNKDFIVRRIRQVTLGVLPSGNMLAAPFAKFSITGGAPTREQAANTTANLAPPANVATTTEISASAEADVLYDHYKPEESAVFGQDDYSAGITVTGTDIAAVDAGNKLTKASGGWGGLAIGAIVLVTGIGARFLARVSGAVTTTDLPLDVNWKDLADVSAGSSVTVRQMGQIRVGSGQPTYSYEIFNPVSGHGDEVTLGINSLAWNLQHPNKLSQTLQFTGMKRILLASALANGTDAYGAQYPTNSGLNFGAALEPTLGGGLRIGGVLQSDVRVTKLDWTLTKSRKTSGHAGAFGPQIIYGDERYSLTVNFAVKRDSVDAESLLADAWDPDTVISLGFATMDALGRIKYHYFPALDLTKADPTGLDQSGEEIIEFSGMGHDDLVHSLAQINLLGA